MARAPCPNDGYPYERGVGCPRCGYGSRRNRNDPGQIERLRRRGITTSSTERRRRKQAVEEWRRTHGETCPGYRVPRHRVAPPNRLSADHVVGQARGGQDGPLQILCVSCNSRRAAEETNARRRSR